MGVDVEKYAYYVNKLRQNVGLETWKWRQIVTSQTAHTKCKWSPYDPEPNPPMKIFCVRHCKRHTVNETTWALSTEQRLLSKAGGAKNQRHVANNASQTINRAQQKCTRARDTTRKQNNAK